MPDSMQGQSWLPLLRGRTGRNHFLYEYFNDPARNEAHRPTALALRTRDWKYIAYPDNRELTRELYDLRTDPGELSNRIDRSAISGVRKGLEREFDELLRATAFRFPWEARA